MRYFARFSPVAAYRDLRAFLASRERYELGFLALAIAITAFLIFAFIKDSQVNEYRPPTIIYVKQWRADRTDAQIKAQQLIDEPVKQKQLAIQRAREAKLQAEFKRLDDSLTNMGI